MQKIFLMSSVRFLNLFHQQSCIHLSDIFFCGEEENRKVHLTQPKNQGIIEISGRLKLFVLFSYILANMAVSGGQFFPLWAWERVLIGANSNGISSSYIYLTDIFFAERKSASDSARKSKNH